MNTPQTLKPIVKASPNAFTLLEMAIVLAIIGVVAGGALTLLTASTTTRMVNETVARMETIDKALRDYAVSFGRLPCPASLTLTPSDSNFGIEAASNTNTCIGGTPAANFAASSGTVEGAVPVRTLKLPDSYIYDAWERRFRYGVDPSKTATSSFPVSSGNCTSTKAITVNDSTGAARTSNAVYALVSAGPNGHGAYTKNGVMVNAGSTNSSEQTNCHCTSSAVSTSYTATYVQKLPTLNASSATDIFDDIVSFKEGWQLQIPTQDLSSTPCAQTKYIYVVDYNNHRVQKFDMSGNYVSAIGAGYNGVTGSIGSSGSANGQFNSPRNVALDSAGNVYVTDPGNYRVQVFDSSGNFLRKWGSSGSGNGQFSWGYVGSPYAPLGIAIDSSNNVYLSDGGNARVQKFDSSGTYLSQLGCASGACSISTANGQFNQYVGHLAVDSSDNLYATDGDSTHRVQKFNSSGAYLGTVGCFSSCTNYLYGIQGVAVDQSNNVWVASADTFSAKLFNGTSFALMQNAGATDWSGTGVNGRFPFAIGPVAVDNTTGNVYVSDYSNNRIQIFNSGGTYTSQLGCASGACSASSANGQFNTPFGIAIR